MRDASFLFPTSRMPVQGSSGHEAHRRQIARLNARLAMLPPADRDVAGYWRFAS